MLSGYDDWLTRDPGQEAVERDEWTNCPDDPMERGFKAVVVYSREGFCYECETCGQTHEGDLDRE